MSLILGLETSCDDTAVALVDHNGRVHCSLSANQDLAHAPFGGVVPELASRCHTETLIPLVDLALSNANWSQIDAIAVTARPGLIGSLLVGVVTAKSLALAKGKPLIAVNHIEGHILAPLLRDEEYAPPESFDFPYVALIVSGGHTHLFKVYKPNRYEILGQTRDDAAGEAFDKFAKALGLGFPGGARLDQMARKGDPKAFKFPQGLKSEGLEFSFSGLKTAGLRVLETLSSQEILEKTPDLCASFQAAICDVLINKLDRAFDDCPEIKCATISGGVSANSELRTRAVKWADERGKIIALPPLRYCTDNAAMIARAGGFAFQEGRFSSQEVSPSASAYSSDYL